MRPSCTAMMTWSHCCGGMCAASMLRTRTPPRVSVLPSVATNDARPPQRMPSSLSTQQEGGLPFFGRPDHRQHKKHKLPFGERLEHIDG